MNNETRMKSVGHWGMVVNRMEMGLGCDDHGKIIYSMNIRHELKSSANHYFDTHFSN